MTTENHVQCADIREVRDELIKMRGQIDEQLRRLEKVEFTLGEHSTSIQNVIAAQEGTKAYVAQILDKINSLETRLFQFLTTVTNGATQERLVDRQEDTKERILGSKERSESTTKFLEFTKYVVGITVGALVMYLVKK